MSNSVLIGFTRINVAILALLAIALLSAAACSSDAPEAPFPILITDERVESGAPLYAENCASCHGIPGVSQPPVPNTPPHDGSGHTWHHPDRSLFEWVMDRPPLATTMPGFRGILTNDEVIAILAYIKSTWNDEIQEFQRRGTLQFEEQVPNIELE